MKPIVLIAIFLFFMSFSFATHSIVCTAINISNTYPAGMQLMFSLDPSTFNYSNANADLSDVRILEGDCLNPGNNDYSAIHNTNGAYPNVYLNGSEGLRLYVEKVAIGSQSIIWAKAINSSAQMNRYALIYGYEDAESISNAANVFNYIETFPNLNNWQGQTASFSSQWTGGFSHLLISNVDATDHIIYESNFNWGVHCDGYGGSSSGTNQGEGIIDIAYTPLTSAATGSLYIGTHDGQNLNSIIADSPVGEILDILPNSSLVKVKINNGYVSFTKNFIAGTKSILSLGSKIQTCNNGVTAYYLYDDYNYMATGTSGNWGDTGIGNIKIDAYNTSQQMQIDWIRTRLFVNPLPSFQWGSTFTEATISGGIAPFIFYPPNNTTINSSSISMLVAFTSTIYPTAYCGFQVDNYSLWNTSSVLRINGSWATAYVQNSSGGLFELERDRYYFIDVSALPTGMHNVTMFCWNNGSVGYSLKMSYNLTNKMFITLISPANNSLISNDRLVVDMIVSGVNFTNASCYINYDSSCSPLFNATKDVETYAYMYNLSIGLHNVSVYCQSSANASYNATSLVSTILALPISNNTISITTPLNNATVDTTSITVGILSNYTGSSYINCGLLVDETLQTKDYIYTIFNFGVPYHVWPNAVYYVNTSALASGWHTVSVYCSKFTWLAVSPTVNVYVRPININMTYPTANATIYSASGEIPIEFYYTSGTFNTLTCIHTINGYDDYDDEIYIARNQPTIMYARNQSFGNNTVSVKCFTWGYQANSNSALVHLNNETGANMYYGTITSITDILSNVSMIKIIISLIVLGFAIYIGFTFGGQMAGVILTVCILVILAFVGMLEWWLAIIGLIAAVLAAVFTMNNK